MSQLIDLPDELLHHILSYNILPLCTSVCKLLHTVEESLYDIRIGYLDILYDSTIDNCIDIGDMGAIRLMFEDCARGTSYRCGRIVECMYILYDMLPSDRKYRVADLIHLHEYNATGYEHDTTYYLDALGVWGDITIVERFVFDAGVQADQLQHIYDCALEHNHIDMRNSMREKYNELDT